jgi:hypothetical protein
MAHERNPGRHPDLHAGIDSIAQHHGENAGPAQEVANRRKTRKDHSRTTTSPTKQHAERSIHARLSRKAAWLSGVVGRMRVFPSGEVCGGAELLAV